ncbi:MAG: hypothetical protein ACK53Y_21115, partial [bacterium]
MARTEEVQASPERVSQGLGKTQTAAQRRQERARGCRPPRAAPEQPEASADLGDAAGTREGEGPALSDPGQRAPEVGSKKWLAAFLEKEGIKGGQRSRMVAGILMGLKSTIQPAPELDSSVPAVAVGVLRAERPKDESQWRCRVPTCF